MSVRDLLIVELHNDNFNTFNQTLREALMAVGLVQNASSLYQNGTAVKRKGPMVNDILEKQQQHMLISQQERSKDRAAVSLLKEERRRKRQQLLVLDFKRIVLAKRKMLLRM